MKVSASKLSAAIAVALISAGITSNVQAAGFALIENSASGMGNAFAGGSAIAEDASTVWFNPAGMTRLSGSHMAIAGHIVSPSAEFTNNGSVDATTGPLSGSNDDGGETAFVPNFYYVTELGNESYFGIGVTVPFGLSTEYDDAWVGRYTATKSEVTTININPSFATKATDKLSIGFGFNIQYIDATLANHIDSAATCSGLATRLAAMTPAQTITCTGLGGANIDDPLLDSSQSLSGDDISYGWNLGLLYNLDSESRIGLAYRSTIQHKLEGNVNFTVNSLLATAISTISVPQLTTLLSNTSVEASIDLPESLSVSYFRDIDSALSIMADITWTKWRNFEDLTVIFGNPFQPASVTPEDWENNYRFSFGASYKADDKLTYRAGVAVDQTPIKSAEARTPRIPGNDRTWLSLGVGYKIDTDMTIDIGYSHLFVDDTPINNADASSLSTLTGTYEADVDILSAQANFKF